MTREMPDLRSATAAVDVRGLRRAFGDTVAVDGVDVRVQPGEVVALLGPNGAGKSTLIDTLLGLSRPDSGTVHLFGGPPEAAVARGRVGAMLQSGGLLDHVTVEELVLLAASLYPSPLPVPEVLARAGIADISGRRAARLSGGQIQRVRFALALVSDPELMVLDEPTVALDVEARHEFWGYVRDLADQGRTILFATHYLEEADAFADRVVLLARGQVVADGPPTEIKAVVGRRQVRATLPEVAVADLAALPGVSAVLRAGASVTLECTSSDEALRALLSDYPDARDIEVSGAGLEQAFRHLTGLDRREEMTP